MSKKSTDELLAILKEKTDYNEFLNEYSAEIIGSVSTYLNALMSDITVPILSRKCCISESYLYKLLEGKRTNPSRDTLLQICFGLKLDLEHCNNLLRVGNTNTLYPRIKRDSIIIFCINKNKTLQECDDMLFEAGEKTFIKK
jgi:transcriptional regulator with XRE-family HTH domain